MDISGVWRLERGMPLFRVEHDDEDARKFTFYRTDGDRESFYGHGVIEGDRLLISWRSTTWLGHGSDESRKLEIDRITYLPIEIHWRGGMPIWQTVTN